MVSFDHVSYLHPSGKKKRWRWKKEMKRRFQLEKGMKRRLKFEKNEDQDPIPQRIVERIHET